MKVFGCQSAGRPLAGILVLVASLVLSSGCSKKQEETAVAVPEVAKPAGSAEVPEPEPPPVEPVEPPKPQLPERFEAPADVATAVAAQLEAGEIETVTELIGDEVLAQPGAYGFVWLFEDGGFGVEKENPVTDIGEIKDVKRYAINIAPEEQPEASDKVFLDMVADTTRGWAVDAVNVPPKLQSLARAAGAPAPKPPVVAAPPVEEAPIGDSLMKAENFLSSVLELDYGAAVAMCDPAKVPEEKIAALCIVFEEGSYRMKETKPLMATAIGDDSAWVIAQVESETLNTKSEFGMEMVRNGNGWMIVGLNFSKMLAEYAKASDAGKVPYTPIINNPKGGESLVLYFEYDDAGVARRAQRQIDIVAGILNADPQKTLTISGHADALGTDDYNRDLSARRATSVKAALIAAGVPESQIVTEALGESKPLRPNVNPDGTDNPTGRGHNRRAEVFLNF